MFRLLKAKIVGLMLRGVMFIVGMGIALAAKFFEVFIRSKPTQRNKHH